MTKPILQVALDFIELDRALKCASEALQGGADWLEAGTPLIKSEGLEAVRALKRSFSDTVIVADMKTIDAGRVEVESAAKAGASVVAVLGLASDSTLSECIEAGRNYGAKIWVDLLGVADPATRAKQAQQIGADYLAVHTPIDLQMQGLDPFQVLREVTLATSLPVAVAGGIHSENAPQALAAGASILVVGGAITKSADAAAAARAIRSAIDTGVPVATDLYKRAGETEIRDALERVSTANLSDAMHRSGDLPGLRPVAPGTRLVGRAFTVRAAPGDWSKPVEAIDQAQPGEVIVVEAGGAGPALWGELATHSALQRGLAGVVIDGAIRDTPEIRSLGFPAFARLVTPTAGEPRGLGEIDVPIRVAGAAVRPGDWLVGDDDGVVVIPAERAVEIANRAMDVLEKENRIRQEISQGGTLASVTKLLRWEKIG